MQTIQERLAKQLLRTHAEKGNIAIVVRLNKVTVRGHDKLSPTEIEALSRTHPSMAQSGSRESMTDSTQKEEKE